MLFQIIKRFILINSEVQIIYKRLFNVFVELETDSEDQQKSPQPQNMRGRYCMLFTNYKSPHANTNKSTTQIYPKRTQ